eukprot:TRINITY_DN1490_c0_g1_i1.p1 TRINITY_DN1490_c0_g1~~TRINITY_DN1490_c0_g1_i1.p1  ORF type:complete len:127 (+),score=7.78 TRINITY_DN1490_c0_g1_i1:324-704(+)
MGILFSPVQFCFPLFIFGIHFAISRFFICLQVSFMPVFLIPNRSVHSSFVAIWFRLLHSNDFAKKFRIVHIVDGVISISFLLEFDKSEPFVLLSAVVEGDLNRLDFTKWEEDRPQDLIIDALVEVS